MTTPRTLLRQTLIGSPPGPGTLAPTTGHALLLSAFSTHLTDGPAPLSP
jgi:hypothetical protein